MGVIVIIITALEPCIASRRVFLEMEIERGVENDQTTILSILLQT